MYMNPLAFIIILPVIAYCSIATMNRRRSRRNAGEDNEDQQRSNKVIKRSRRARVSEPIDHEIFPIEVLIEILSRLPIRSIARVMSASQRCKRIISDPYFHHAYASNKPYTVFYDETPFGSSDEQRRLLEVSVHGGCVWTTIAGRKLMPWSKRRSVVGACNGLLCTVEGNGSYEHVIIYNPMTEENGVCLPKLKYGDYKTVKPVYGFGYSPSTRELKVLKAFPGRLSNEPQRTAEIFTVGVKRRWRRLPFCITFSRSDKIVFSDNAFHWFTWDNPLLGDYDKGSSITIHAFDVTKEKLGEIGSPDGVLFFRNGVKLTTLNGNLCLVDYFPSQFVVIWKMEVYGIAETWNKMVVLKSCLGFDSIDDYVMPFSGLTNGNILMLDMNRALSWFCPKTNRYEEVVKGSPDGPLVSSLFEFTPSFSPIEEMIRPKLDLQAKFEFGVYPMPVIY